jgi:hypothetical protein
MPIQRCNKTAGRIVAGLFVIFAAIGYIGDWGAILSIAVILLILEWIT